MLNKLINHELENNMDIDNENLMALCGNTMDASSKNDYVMMANIARFMYIREIHYALRRWRNSILDDYMTWVIIPERKRNALANVSTTCEENKESPGENSMEVAPKMLSDDDSEALPESETEECPSDEEWCVV
ncbi:hypothetical protein RIF29_38112 [Crotalaria pallida]|uniref:Uncharacterized protein n=1 Tax=Crotalaria pallida TaxID=3830 RepID=A0AAN9DYJ7_CROPI